jgi:D-arginine dehydrogenase
LNRWAGLRVFAPDRSPVIGPDPETKGFIWCVALGGYGIQTAPAMARFCAALACHEFTASDLESPEVTEISPSRLFGANAQLVVSVANLK